MDNPTFNSFFNTIEEIARAVARSVRYAIDAIKVMSWPALLITCIAMALLITIVPLAIGLFLVFMAVKVIFSCVSDRVQRGPATPHTPVDTKGE